MHRNPWYTKLAVHAVLIVLALPFVMPLGWMLSTSLKTNQQAQPKVVSTDWGAFLGQWWPNPAQWHNYPDSLSYVPFPQYLRNTIMLCAFNVVGAVGSSAVAAYAFAKMQWRGRNLVFGIVIATMILPGEVRTIPIFALFRWLRWYGSYLPLIVPAFFGNAFFIFLLRQFFRTIPDDLIEAARVDGCSDWRILWRVVLPLSRPALATCACSSSWAPGTTSAGRCCTSTTRTSTPWPSASSSSSVPTATNGPC